MAIKNAIIVKNKTRLELLIERFNTPEQAKFYIQRSGGEFSDYELEHDNFYRSMDKILLRLSRVLKTKILERMYLPSYIFSDSDLVVVVGQDGLVANTAKYVNNIPIIAINPDADRFDGVLLPFEPSTFIPAVEKTLTGNYPFKMITMAEATLSDGQRLLAFNDLFIGPTTHVSARYRITFGDLAENHSSSGIIVSTGAGSTGWLSSLFNMANGIADFMTGKKNTQTKNQTKLQTKLQKKNQAKFQRRFQTNTMPMDAAHLMFIVREPFSSKVTQTGLTAGKIEGHKKLVVESFMPANGIIFSDGIEADFLKFNSGAIATIGVAQEKAKLVMA
ncbi:MAG: sugar kinase [bacterium]|nr:sugar kinase [bacterium]